MRENPKNTGLNESEWESMGNFISNLAHNNESVTDNIVVEKTGIKNMTGTKPRHSGKTADLQADLNTALPKNQSTLRSSLPAGGFDNIHSDIRNLLDELQEIKKARIDLQSKLNTIRQ